MTKVYITAIKLSGGSMVRHIVNVWYGPSPSWSQSDTKQSTSAMADLIDGKRYQAWVRDLANRQEAEVLVVRPSGKPKYLRTKADDDPNDNLLKLPQKQ